MFLKKVLGLINLTRPYILLTSSLFFVGSAFMSVNGIPPLRHFIVGFTDVGLAIAAAHVMNDVFDWKEDSRNPRTAKRPIPTGIVSPKNARLFAITLAISAIGLTFLLNVHSTLIALMSVPLPFLYDYFRRHQMPLSFTCPVIAEQGIILFGSVSVTGKVLIDNIWLLLILSVFWEAGRTISSELQDVTSDKNSKISSLSSSLSPRRAASLALIFFSISSVVSVFIGIVKNLGVFYLITVTLSGFWLNCMSITLVKKPTAKKAVKLRANAPKYIIVICIALVFSYIIP